MKQNLIVGTFTFLLAAFAAEAATVSGTVRLASRGANPGAVVPGAKVVIVNWGTGGAGERLDSIMTDAEGEYAFEDVPTGAKQVQVSKESYKTGLVLVNVANRNGSYTANVTLASSATVGAVSGTVRAGSSQGNPVPGATVIIARPAAGGSPAWADTATSNAQGRYAFDSVAALDDYVVSVRAAGYQLATNSGVDVPAGDTAEYNFVLTQIPGPGSVAGTVRISSTQNQVAGATVILTRSGSRPDTVKTNGEGQYAFDSVAALTNYTITVSAAGYQTAVNADVDVVPNQTSIVDFRLVPTGSGATRGIIMGAVLTLNNKPVAGARLILSRTGTGGGSGAIDTVVADSAGQYVFEQVAAQSNYTLTVSASGYHAASNNNVDVVAGQVTWSDFLLLSSTGLRVPAAADGQLRLLPSRGASLSLGFAAAPWAGRLAAYDLRGALAYSLAVPAGASSLSVPARGGIRCLVLERAGMVERLMVPAGR